MGESKVDISLLTEGEARKEVLKLISQSEAVDIAVAWAGQKGITDTLLAHGSLLRHVVVGTHMYQTDPEVLEQLKQFEAGCMPPDGTRLFHPKVYFFELGDTAAALVGSHNMTSSAFDGHNIEAGVLMRGSVDAPILQELASFIHSAWEGSEDITGDFLLSYRTQYELHRDRKKALAKFHRVRNPRSGASRPSPMRLTWQDFLEGVRNDPHGSPEGRLEILEAARDLFERKGSLKHMTQNERCALAGTGSQQQSKTYRGLHWSWFGTMRGLGTFASLINKAPDNISDALDHIPLSGNVDQEHYENFVADFSRAFSGEPRAGNIATASRLLAMKRPDQFIAINRANQRGLAEGFGVGYTTIRLDTYWSKIVIPTMAPYGLKVDCGATFLTKKLLRFTASLVKMASDRLRTSHDGVWRAGDVTACWTILAAAHRRG